MSSRNPEDLTGLPWGDAVNDVTAYRPQPWLKRLSYEGVYGVLVIDDLPAAPNTLQIAARQLSLARRVHECSLSPLVFVLITGNRREDKSGARTLPAHFLNSVSIQEVTPDLDEWCIWYAKQPYLTSLIPAFLRFRPEHLSRLPKDGDEHGSYATPRTWEMLGEDYAAAVESGTLLESARGLVGEGVGSEFVSFCMLREQLQDPEAVLKNPQQALPDVKKLDSMDKIAAMATALAEFAGKWEKGDNEELRRIAPLQLLRALSWVTSRHREYVAAGLNTYLANGGKVATVVGTAKQHKTDPLVRDLYMDLKNMLRGE